METGRYLIDGVEVTSSDTRAQALLAAAYNGEKAPRVTGNEAALYSLADIVGTIGRVQYVGGNDEQARIGRMAHATGTRMA